MPCMAADKAGGGRETEKEKERERERKRQKETERDRKYYTRMRVGHSKSGSYTGQNGPAIKIKRDLLYRVKTTYYIEQTRPDIKSKIDQTRWDSKRDYFTDYYSEQKRPDRVGEGGVL